MVPAAVGRHRPQDWSEAEQIPSADSSRDGRGRRTHRRSRRPSPPGSASACAPLATLSSAAALHPTAVAVACPRSASDPPRFSSSAEGRQPLASAPAAVPAPAPAPAAVRGPWRHRRRALALQHSSSSVAEPRPTALPLQVHSSIREPEKGYRSSRGSAPAGKGDGPVGVAAAAALRAAVIPSPPIAIAAAAFTRACCRCSARSCRSRRQRFGQIRAQSRQSRG
eukprot:COSAG04_NODE_2100_length_4781_cov_8.111064_6_plen_224_part_00